MSPTMTFPAPSCVPPSVMPVPINATLTTAQRGGAVLVGADRVPLDRGLIALEPTSPTMRFPVSFSVPPTVIPVPVNQMTGTS